jgi:hypothetical protein
MSTGKDEMNDSWEKWAEDFSASVLAPLREVGTLLASEIDKLRAEVDALRNDVDALGRVLASRTDHLV